MGDYRGFKSVTRWLDGFASATRPYAYSALRGFLDWLGVYGGRFVGLTPDQLVEWQREHPNGFELLDLLQEYVRGKRGRVNYKRNIYNAVRSFFGHNRAEMPRDRRFRIHGDVPAVVGRLGVEELRRILLASNPMYRAVFLCMFQGGMGIGELLHWSRTGLEGLRMQLRDGVRLVRVELPGRKANRNRKPYYTFLGRDAQEALRAWLRI
ncbi:MAG: hypothetical protein QXD04_03005, partial [Candidatus Bathyarchaeia archaeon]